MHPGSHLRLLRPAYHRYTVPAAYNSLLVAHTQALVVHKDLVVDSLLAVRTVLVAHIPSVVLVRNTHSIVGDIGC
jgi:hypothetical protein